MCLKVATKKLTAKTDLLVFKCLDVDGSRYCTPFRYYPIFFDGGVCRLNNVDKTLTLEKELCDGTLINVINFGVHAFYKKREADWTASQFPSCGTKTFYAVIPKGCKYYLGINFDIVSTEMIIFRSKRAYDKYAKEHEVKEI